MKGTLANENSFEIPSLSRYTLIIISVGEIVMLTVNSPHVNGAMSVFSRLGKFSSRDKKFLGRFNCILIGGKTCFNYTANKKKPDIEI